MTKTTVIRVHDALAEELRALMEKQQQTQRQHVTMRDATEQAAALLWEARRKRGLV